MKQTIERLEEAERAVRDAILDAVTAQRVASDLSTISLRRSAAERIVAARAALEAAAAKLREGA